MAKKKLEFPKLTATDVKDALRKKHPATSLKNTQKPIPGQWTTFEEYHEVDFLAVSAHSAPIKGNGLSIRYPWIGYEVKISRSDMRSELLKPMKRWKAKRMCNQFYFAVPKGMLSDEEKKFVEPDWDNRDFIRERCPAGCHQRQIIEYRKGGKKAYSRGYNIYQHHTKRKTRYGDYKKVPASIGKGLYSIITQEEVIAGDYEYPTGQLWETCSVCKGTGYKERSRVEREGPTLWIPKDMGLLEVAETGTTRIIKKAPIEDNTDWIKGLNARELNNLIRWISLRPDPRHENVISDLSVLND